MQIHDSLIFFRNEPLCRSLSGSLCPHSCGIISSAVYPSLPGSFSDLPLRKQPGSLDGRVYRLRLDSIPRINPYRRAEDPPVSV